MFRTRDYNNIFGEILGAINHSQNERKRKEYNITNVNGFDGVANVNIPHKYNRVEYKNGYYFCSEENIHVYTKKGTHILQSTNVNYLGNGMFLSQEINKKKNKDELGYALYKEGCCLTDFIYKPHGMSSTFNKSGFIMLNVLDNYSHTVVLNTEGKEMYRDTNYDRPYLYEAILSTKEGYLNLFTHKYICEKGYSSTLTTKRDRFVKISEDCVYQINIFTGEVIVHGGDEIKEAPLTTEEKNKREAEREELMRKKAEKDERFRVEHTKWKSLNRNSIYLCGSKKKFKNCCISGWEYKLRRKHEAMD